MYYTFSLVSGASLGAGLMYLFDPDRGRRRRALMRDKGNRWSRKTKEFAGSASRDVRNRVPRVMQMFNRLERHRSGESVPQLQGGKTGLSSVFMQSHWSPATRLAAAVMGGTALLYGINRRTVGSSTLAASGLGLLVRSATNQQLARLFNFTDAVGRQEFKKAA